jgi:hypothetical protein
MKHFTTLQATTPSDTTVIYLYSVLVIRTFHGQLFGLFSDVFDFCVVLSSLLLEHGCSVELGELSDRDSRLEHVVQLLKG